MRTKILKTSLEKVCFPNQINLAEATPVFKKEDELSKENYRPISVVSHAFKIFEKIVFKGLRKNHSSQNDLLNMIEKLKHDLDTRKMVYLKRLIHLMTIYY